MNHDEAIRSFEKSLRNVEKWMDKAEAFAKAKSFDVAVLAQSRLAPDQFGFVQQVQSACDQAKYAAAYLGGKPPPSHPDTEKTFTTSCTSRSRTSSSTRRWPTTILRHNGVELGKMDYIGGLPTKDG